MADQPRAGDDVVREVQFLVGQLYPNDVSGVVANTIDALRSLPDGQRIEAMGMELYGEVMWDDEEEQEVVRPVIGATPGASVFVDSGWVDGD